MALALVIKVKSRIKPHLGIWRYRAAVTEEIVEKDGSLGQPMRSRCSSGNLGVVRMPLGCNIRKRMLGTVWLATVPALVVLSSLLVAQNVPLQFPTAPSARQSSIDAGSAQCQTQRFEVDGAQWITPIVATAILPSTGRANCTFTQKQVPAIEIKGFHFNRPPPTT
jgi:hypothetical protein